MKDIRTLICRGLSALALALSLVSCEKKVVTVVTFQPKMEILTKSVCGGENFSFRIYSNTGSFVVKEITCTDWDGLTNFDFNFKGLSVGSENRVGDDGWAVFEAEKVNVKSQHTGTIRVTVSDPVTGDEATMTGDYLAFINFMSNGIRINCENNMVVDGDDFSFTVQTNLERFTVTDFHCPFLTGSVLVKGATYECDRYGNADFVIPSVSIKKEATDSVWVDIKDVATGKSLHVSAEFELKPSFEVSVFFHDVYSDDGEMRMEIESNRNVLGLKEFILTQEKAGLLLKDGGLVSSGTELKLVSSLGKYLTAGMDINMPASSLSGGGKYNDTFTATGITSKKSQKVTVRITVYDYDTMRSSTLDGFFEVKAYTYPAYIEVTDPQTGAKVVLEEGSTNGSETLNRAVVSYYDGSPMGKERGLKAVPFRFLTLDGEPVTQEWSYRVTVNAPSGCFKASKNDVDTDYKGDKMVLTGTGTGGTIYLRGNDSPGDGSVVLRTQMAGNTELEREVVIPVKVRKRVALVLNATFRQVPELDREDSFLFNAKSSTIDVATWSGPADLTTLKASEVEKKAGLSTINDGGSGLEVTLKTEAYPVTYKTKFFQGLCNIGKFGQSIYGYEYCPGGNITKFGDESVYSGNPCFFICSNLKYGKNEVGEDTRKPFSNKEFRSPQNLTEYLNHWNDCGIWYTHDDKYKEVYEQMIGMDGYFQFLTRWEKFNISVSDIKYDKDNYDFRYVIYKWGTDANNDVYWWGTNSKVYVKDVQGLSDLMVYFFGKSDILEPLLEHYLTFIKPNNSSTSAIFNRSILLENFTGRPVKELPVGKYPVANQVPWCQEWKE